jgi:hypothetical protein
VTNFRLLARLTGAADDDEADPSTIRPSWCSTPARRTCMTIWDLVMMFVGIAFVVIMFLVIHYR